MYSNSVLSKTWAHYIHYTHEVLGSIQRAPPRHTVFTFASNVGGAYRAFLASKSQGQANESLATA